MATAIAPTQTTPPIELPPADVIRRHVKRSLPVSLRDDELLDIAKENAKKRRMLRQLEADLAAEKEKRNQQIKELQREIDTHDRELDTEEQERIVLCDEIFRAGTVFTRRSDTGEEFEPRPATPQEAQRYLPAVESTMHTLPGALDHAAAAQGRVVAATDAAEGEDDEDAEEPEDDGLTELTPAQIAAKESASARKARRATKGKAK